MANLKPSQTIAIGVACLFGIPICIGLVVGRLVGFWAGVVTTVVAIAIIAYIAQRWWQKQRKQNEDKDKDG